MLALLVGGGTVLAIRARPRIVTVALPTFKQVTESIAASGRLRGATESNIGAQSQGRIAAILVHEGDTVVTGQVIARLDDGVPQAQVRQAQVAARTARGQLAQAEASVRISQAQLAQVARLPLAADIARLRADITQANAVNAARLTAAKQKATSLYQHYQELKSGARPEEIEQAGVQVKQAQASLDQYERDWVRQQELYKQGVIPRSEAEQAETLFLTGKQTRANAQSKSRQLRAGSRPEEIAGAEADYRAAEADVASGAATLRGARRSGEAQFASLLSSPRPEDVEVARRRLIEARLSRDVSRARLEEAGVALTLAKQRQRETVVTAPFVGTVTRIVTEVGSVTGPSTPLARLVRTGTPEIRIDLDESNLGKLHVGQEAIVTNDAFPDSRFTAIVHAIGAQVDTDRGTVEVRLTPKDPPDWIHPGQTFTVNIVLGPPRRRFVVPTTAVSTVSGVSSLLAVEDGKVVKRRIKAAPISEGGIPVLDGITLETKVIIEPTGLTAGDAVISRKIPKNE